MALRIEDYALIGDTQSAALVGRDGSIDWACLPRFDSGACFAALVGTRDNGRWAIQPEGPFRPAGRRYRPGTMVLETDFEADEGAMTVVDFMPVRGDAPRIIRIVEGRRGTVNVRSELIIRFDHGRITPWVRKVEDSLVAVCGPDALCLRADVEVHGEDMSSVSRFRIGAGERRAFVLSWYPSHEHHPEATDASSALRRTERWWRFWSHHCTPWEPWAEPVGTSLRVLKALTYGPTGGMVAAPTTSLPEQPGGVRNWDYRYCWLRDATLTLDALMLAGYTREAEAWREWLLRAVAGDPARLQTIYGVAGERRLPEWEAHWLPGYENAHPVRIGNDAYRQLQLDVYGEVLNALYAARQFEIAPDEWAWPLERRLLETLEGRWREPDEGIWEIRGPRQHFTHSKVMCWVAFDRAIRSIEQFQLPGPVDRWRAIRDEIHAEVCARAFDSGKNSFVQAYGRSDLDATLLMIPLVGFLPASDPRVAGTVAAVERELLVNGFVLRYRTDLRRNPRTGSEPPGPTPRGKTRAGTPAMGSLGRSPSSPDANPSNAVDGLPPGEGVFLPCSFWLAEAYVELGRREEAVQLFERLVALRNDVGLLPEEYDPVGKRFLGNFPQAFSHLALVSCAYSLLGHAERPAPLRHQSVAAHRAGTR